MSRFFRRSDDSDSSSSSSFESESEDGPSLSETSHQGPLRSKHREPSAEDDAEPSEIDRSNARSIRRARTDQTLSTDGSVSRSYQDAMPQANADANQHQEMLLATLLEEHYRNRAAEFLNTANPGSNYTRHSPEVQPLAQ